MNNLRFKWAFTWYQIYMWVSVRCIGTPISSFVFGQMINMNFLAQELNAEAMKAHHKKMYDALLESWGEQDEA